MKSGEALSSLEPNLSSILVTNSNFQEQIGSISGQQMSLLRMTICHQQVSTDSFNQANSNLAQYYLVKTPAQINLQQQQPAFGQVFEQQTTPPLTKLMLDYVIGPMQLIDTKLDYYFSEFWIENGDERSSQLPFMSGGPWKLIYATLIYLYLIKLLLPKLMRNSKPLELNWCIRFYNLLMVLSNIYAFYHGARILNFGTKCFGCEVINHKDYSLDAMELLHFGWLFFLSRIVEWLDTIFFVLRKKERQVTKLHVFHHSFVPILCWTYLKFHPGATVAFFPLVNTFVHTIMYTYYLLATFGPNVQAYLWWKKYLTSLQITQFVLILMQLATIPMSSNEMCQYPRGFLYVAIGGAVLFLWLFYTYYIDTYRKSADSLVRMTDALASSSDKSNGKHKTANRSGQQNARKLQQREGSSRSISDLVDNAIDNYEAPVFNQSSKLVKRTSFRC